MSDLLFVVVEKSQGGETVLGAFSSLERARAQLPPANSGRLEDYRVECHLIDESIEERPWQVAISRAGEVEDVMAAVFCACDDDDQHFRDNSFIEPGGGRMHVIVLAKSPGTAIAAARDYRSWLVEGGRWQNEGGPVEPISAGS